MFADICYNNGTNYQNRYEGALNEACGYSNDKSVPICCPYNCLVQAPVSNPNDQRAPKPSSSLAAACGKNLMSTVYENIRRNGLQEPANCEPGQNYQQITPCTCPPCPCVCPCPSQQHQSRNISMQGQKGRRSTSTPPNGAAKVCFQDEKFSNLVPPAFLCCDLSSWNKRPRSQSCGDGCKTRNCELIDGQACQECIDRICKPLQIDNPACVPSKVKRCLFVIPMNMTEQNKTPHVSKRFTPQSSKGTSGTVSKIGTATNSRGMTPSSSKAPSKFSTKRNLNTLSKNGSTQRVGNKPDTTKRTPGKKPDEDPNEKLTEKIMDACEEYNATMKKCTYPTYNPMRCCPKPTPKEEQNTNCCCACPPCSYGGGNLKKKGQEQNKNNKDENENETDQVTGTRTAACGDSTCPCNDDAATQTQEDDGDINKPMCSYCCPWWMYGYYPPCSCQPYCCCNCGWTSSPYFCCAPPQQNLQKQQQQQQQGTNQKPNKTIKSPNNLPQISLNSLQTSPMQSNMNALPNLELQQGQEPGQGQVLGTPIGTPIGTSIGTPIGSPIGSPGKQAPGTPIHLSATTPPPSSNHSRDSSNSRIVAGAVCNYYRHNTNKINIPQDRTGSWIHYQQCCLNPSFGCYPKMMSGNNHPIHKNPYYNIQN